MNYFILKNLKYIILLYCSICLCSCTPKQLKTYENVNNKIQLKANTDNKLAWGHELKNLFIPGNSDDYDIILETDSELVSEKINETKFSGGGQIEIHSTVKYKYILTIYDRYNNILTKSNNILEYNGVGRGSNETSARSDVWKWAQRLLAGDNLLLAIKTIESSNKLKYYECIVNTKRLEPEIIVWTSINSNKSDYSKDPFSRITKITQNKIDFYLMPRKGIDVSEQIPPMIPNPIIPQPPILTKSEFETKDMFNKRVDIILKDRETQIHKLQEKYRNDVLERNNKIEELKDIYNESIVEIKKEQKYKKSILNKKITEFTNEAFDEVMGKPIFYNLQYDPESETMYADLKASSALYNIKISFKIPLQFAENFKLNIDDVVPFVTFTLTNNTIKLAAVKALFIDKQYTANMTNNNYVPEKIAVELKDRKIEFDSDKQSGLVLQNPNLIDKYDVSTIKYSENKGTKELINDDLSDIITQYKPKEENQKKWLFVVAVENYDYADKINYVENSAVAFKKTAQKVFGISDRNTYALIESNATAGAIEGNLSRMLENVKEDDTIYFYYSGHGVPSPASGEAYILPKDSIVDYITTKDQFQLSSMYKKLSDSKASKIISFTDCCFSGKTDNVMNYKGVAPGLIRSKSVSFNERKMVVITAGKNTQFSNQYREKGHRLFSYYLIKSLLTRNGLEIMDIYKDLSLKVKDTSNAVGDSYRQEPQIYGNTTINLL